MTGVDDEDDATQEWLLSLQGRPEKRKMKDTDMIDNISLK